MRNFQDTFETGKWSFISALSICMTVPLTDPTFQWVNRLFVSGERTSCKRYCLPTREVKNYVMIDGQKVFDQPVRNDLITYDNIRTVATGQVYKWLFARLYLF